MEINKLTEQEMSKLLEEFMKETAEKTGIPFESVETMVYEGQWRAVWQALKVYKSVEITGLGKFEIRKGKVLKFLDVKSKACISLINRNVDAPVLSTELYLIEKSLKDFHFLIFKLDEEDEQHKDYLNIYNQLLETYERNFKNN